MMDLIWFVIGLLNLWAFSVGLAKDGTNLSILTVLNLGWAIYGIARLASSANRTSI